MSEQISSFTHKIDSFFSRWQLVVTNHNIHLTSEAICGEKMQVKEPMTALTTA